MEEFQARLAGKVADLNTTITALIDEMKKKVSQLEATRAILADYVKAQPAGIVAKKKPRKSVKRKKAVHKKTPQRETAEKEPTAIDRVRAVLRDFDDPIRPCDIKDVLKKRGYKVVMKFIHQTLYLGKKKGLFMNSKAGWMLTEEGEREE